MFEAFMRIVFAHESYVAAESFLCLKIVPEQCCCMQHELILQRAFDLSVRQHISYLFLKYKIAKYLKDAIITSKIISENIRL
jgi:hypothetical protein